MVCTDWTNKKMCQGKCYCWLCDIFYFFSNQYFSTALNFTFSIIWIFDSIYSFIVTVSPDAIKRVSFRPVICW